jgi:hypothetical protein
MLGRWTRVTDLSTIDLPITIRKIQPGATGRSVSVAESVVAGFPLSAATLSYVTMT